MLDQGVEAGGAQAWEWLELVLPVSLEKMTLVATIAGASVRVGWGWALKDA